VTPVDHDRVHALRANGDILRYGTGKMVAGLRLWRSATCTCFVKAEHSWFIVLRNRRLVKMKTPESSLQRVGSGVALHSPLWLLIFVFENSSKRFQQMTTVSMKTHFSPSFLSDEVLPLFRSNKP
jgi:hypothetical protein